MGRAALARLLCVLGLCLAWPTLAHQGGTTAYAAISIAGNALRYQLTLSQWPAAFLTPLGGNLDMARTRLPPAIAAQLHFSNATEACAVANARLAGASAEQQGVGVVLEVVCRDAITTLGIKDDTFDVLGTDLHTLARIDWPDGSSQFAFAAESRALSLPVATAAPRAQGLVSFFQLGLLHILGGYDHLLFLLALLLVPASGWGVVRVITAFTVAHSLTLGLTALDLLHLPPALIETAIAGSIAWVAGENLRRGAAASHRVWITGLFGLIHGCGFADILVEVGLPRGHLLEALLGFNLGVEAGQLLIVLPLLPVLRWLWRQRFGQRTTRAVSMLLCGVGLVLMVMRLISPA